MLPALCQSRLALLRVDAHERAVGVFPQGIERDQPSCHWSRLVVRAIGHMPDEHSGQRLTRKIAQALALHKQPLFEGRIANLQAIEQVASVEGHRSRDGLRRSFADQSLEFRDIDRYSSRVKRDELPIGQ